MSLWHALPTSQGAMQPELPGRTVDDRYPEAGLATLAGISWCVGAHSAANESMNRPATCVTGIGCTNIPGPNIMAAGFCRDLLKHIVNRSLFWYAVRDQMGSFYCQASEEEHGRVTTIMQVNHIQRPRPAVDFQGQTHLYLRTGPCPAPLLTTRKMIQKGGQFTRTDSSRT